MAITTAATGGPSPVESPFQVPTLVFRFWSALATPLTPGHQQQHHSQSGLSGDISSSAVLNFTGDFLMANRASSIAWGIGSRNA